MDQSFPTWSFDKPCKSMEWSKISNVALTSESDLSTLEENADLVIIGVTAPAKADDDDDEKSEEKEEPVVLALQGTAKSIDEGLNGALSDLLAETVKSFKNGAKMGSFTPTLRAVGTGSKAKRYVVLGLGSAPKEGEPVDLTAAAGLALGKALAEKVTAEKKVVTVHVLLPATITANATVIRDVSTAFYQDLHADNRYRTGDKINKVAEDLQTVKLFTEGGGGGADQTAIDNGKKLATGVLLTKDIVNAPHNVLNSESLAETAKRIAKESPGGRIKCEILGQKECEARGMGAYLGVARGSETEPQFIHLTYTPPPGGKAVNKKVGVIGKGLLFDTGGYNIKTQMMELMKFDCGGSAAVLGAARAIGELQPQGVEAHFIVAACENMINDKAMVPSDILTASNGKTIEVMNTDAEGRLTLADALVFADKEVGCESIIELSTLTGACMVALGKQISGVWTDNEDLAAELADISKVTGDKSWRMPLAKEYNEELESKFADIKNIGGRYGGSITAALFLQNFVSKKKPFAHIDIAGPVWSDKTGATGFGAKLVVEWITRQGSKE
jgi:leucyl aminopeptidase